MLTRLLAASACALLAGACAYYPTPPDQVRLRDSNADIRACTRLAPVSDWIPTNGVDPVLSSTSTTVVPASQVGGFLGPQVAVQPQVDNLSARLDVMRGHAIVLGATDVLLQRRSLRGWSWIRGVAYRCRG